MARPASRNNEQGVLMVALMAGIAIAMILGTVAVQAWADIARRDAEAEMMFRAEDIVRGIKRYQAGEGKLPLEFKVLIEPGQKGQYYLRKLWKDPLVKGGQWQFVYANPAGGLYDPSDPTSSPTGAPPQPGASPGGLKPIDPLFPPTDKGAGGSPEANGLPIAGVKTRCTDHPFRRYREKSEYSEWVFSIFDQNQLPGTAVTGQQQGGPSFPPPADKN